VSPCMHLTRPRELEEGHTCNLHPLTWSSSCFWKHYLGGQWHTCGDIPLAILGVDHLFSLWSAPSSWHFAHSSMELAALEFTHMDWLHAFCEPLAILRWLLWSILLGGLLYFFSLMHLEECT
jgi:hypothetical protein